MTEPTWEPVCDSEKEGTVERLRVPGGWIYNVFGHAKVFVPDPMGPRPGECQVEASDLDGPPPAPFPYQIQPPPPMDAASIKKRLLEQMTSPETKVYVEVVLEVLKTPEAQRVLAAIREALAGAKACPVCLGSGEFQGGPCQACRGKA